MALLLIARIMAGKSVAGYRIFDTSANYFRDFPTQQMLTILRSKPAGFISNLGYDPTTRQIIGTNGGLERYCQLSSKTLKAVENPHSLVIICRQLHKSGLKSYQVVNALGKVGNAPEADIIAYETNKRGYIANGKIMERDGQKYISSIRGEYEVVEIDSALDRVGQSTQPSKPATQPAPKPAQPPQKPSASKYYAISPVITPQASQPKSPAETKSGFDLPPEVGSYFRYALKNIYPSGIGYDPANWSDQLADEYFKVRDRAECTASLVELYKNDADIIYLLYLLRENPSSAAYKQITAAQHIAMFINCKAPIPSHLSTLFRNEVYNLKSGILMTGILPKESLLYASNPPMNLLNLFKIPSLLSDFRKMFKTLTDSPGPALGTLANIIEILQAIELVYRLRNEVDSDASLKLTRSNNDLFNTLVYQPIADNGDVTSPETGALLEPDMLTVREILENFVTISNKHIMKRQ